MVIAETFGTAAQEGHRVGLTKMDGKGLGEAMPSAPLDSTLSCTIPAETFRSVRFCHLAP